LVRGEANITGSIIFGLEVVIILSHATKNDQEQFSGHPIAVTKCLLFIKWINQVKVVLAQAGVASFSIMIDVGLHLLR
jgi:hypothetical protein